MMKKKNQIEYDWRDTNHKRDSTYIVIILLFWDGLNGEPYGAWPYIGTCLTFMYGIGMVSTCHALLGKRKSSTTASVRHFDGLKKEKIYNKYHIIFLKGERERVPDPSQRSSSHGFVRSLLFGRVLLLHARYLVIFWTLLYSKSWACCAFLLRNSLPII